MANNDYKNSKDKNQNPTSHNTFSSFCFLLFALSYKDFIIALGIFSNIKKTIPKQIILFAEFKHKKNKQFL